jgi:hypothetical protein
MANQLSDVLDVGCGPQCLPGAVGIDARAFPGVQFIHDLNQSPWPLPEKHFRKVRVQHVIEHIRELQVFVRELQRVCADGAIIEYTTPHYSSYASWGDPTHLHHFALASIPLLYAQNFSAEQFQITRNDLRFTGSIWEWPGHLIYLLSRKRFEKNFAWVWPANEIKTNVVVRH